eukprot:m.76038 g.76038  ORF g.76038 m.76038 type:complete len:88 (+) comp10478_c0_seq2:369-632(+)
MILPPTKDSSLLQREHRVSTLQVAEQLHILLLIDGRGRVLGRLFALCHVAVRPHMRRYKFHLQSGGATALEPGAIGLRLPRHVAPRA